jgi:hypothetical protein
MSVNIEDELHLKKCIALYSESVKFENRLQNLNKNTTQKTKDRATQAPLKTEVNSCELEG